MGWGLEAEVWPKPSPADGEAALAADEGAVGGYATVVCFEFHTFS